MDGEAERDRTMGNGSQREESVNSMNNSICFCFLTLRNCPRGTRIS